MMDTALGNNHGAVREAAAGRVVVVIPTLDEEQSIADVVRSIPRAIVSRVIVADGGSRDATAARAKAAGADVLDAGRGYGRAWRRRGGNSKVAGSLIGTLRAGARIIATFARVSSETSPWRHRRDRRHELSNVR